MAYLGTEEPSHDPEAAYYCDGLIVRGEPMLILGDPKVGKTLAVEDLAVRLAAGASDFCGRRIYQRARVLLVPREDSVIETKRRIWQITRALRIDHRDLVGWLEIDGTTPLRFDDAPSVARFRAALARFDVAFIDSLSTIHESPEENSNGSMKPITDAWRELSLGTATTIAIVHHLRKPGELGSPGPRGRKLNRSRGASIIGATARHAVVLEDGPAAGQVRITVEGNHFGMPDPFVIARVSGDDATGAWVRHELIASASAAAGSSMDAKMIDALADMTEPILRADLAKVLGGNRADTLAAVRTAVERGLLVALPPGPDDDHKAQPVMLADRARSLGYQPPPVGSSRLARWGRP